MAEQKKESRFKVKIPKLNASNKTYDFSLSLPGMISAVGAGVLALTFFFVMGILIGRGYRPEKDVPQLQQIMPSKQHGELAEGQAKPEILKPEELEYPERLKQKPETMMAEVKPEPKPEPKQETKPTPQPEKKAEEKAKEADAEKPEVFQTPAAQPGEKVFDYTYQVASFKKQDMAEALSAKLVNAGLRTDIVSGEVKGTTWYRVHVLHHGTPASTDDMKAVLAKFGIKKPLLKRKKAVE